MKKLLSLSLMMVAMIGVSTAQTFEFQDKNDNNIGGTHHYEFGDGTYLSSTKFHVKNVSGNAATYKCKVYEVSNPTNSDLQVCFGTACYAMPAGNSGAQGVNDSALVASGGTDLNYKAGPFSFSWASGDSATWRITIYNNTNPNDSASALITWKFQGASVSELTGNDVTVNAYPNPASGNVNISYTINKAAQNTNVVIYDMVGKEVKKVELNDSNGVLKMDVSDLQAGVYFYAVQSNDKAIKTERLIIK